MAHSLLLSWVLKKEALTKPNQNILTLFSHLMAGCKLPDLHSLSVNWEAVIISGLSEDFQHQ